MKLIRTALATALLTAACAAHAHDTWFEPLSTTAAGSLLALGTGNQFPQMESAMGAQSLVQSGCHGAAGAVQKLAVQQQAPGALLVRAPAQASSCWAQSQPFDIQLGTDKVAVYLKEIQASAAVRAAWADMQGRGLPWRERYVKHARVNLRAGAESQATPMAMDLLINNPDQPLRPGATFTATVLRDGQPLADQPIELRGDKSPLGIWRRSDAQGQVQFSVPLAGRWLLRGTDLRLSAERPDSWDSRFVTLVFDVAGEGRQNGSSFNSNARSTNQAAAITAINSEPAINTTRR